MLENIKIKTFLTLSLCVSMINLYAQDATTGATETISKKIKKSSEQKWLEAVSQGKKDVAIKLASEIVNTEDLKDEPHSPYIFFAEKENIKKDFFKAPFNQWDFKLWYDACFFKRIADQEKSIINKQKVTDKNNALFGILFRTVVNRIKPIEKKYALIPWPSEVWIRKFGVCDRQSWLLSELAYQAGFDVQIVYLINPESGISPHTICEVLIQDDNGNVTRSVADPFSKVLLKGKSVSDLAVDKELMKKIWPENKIEHKEWWKALPNSIFWTPSYPQDYCSKNQMLYRKLSAKLGSACPRFGEDPNRRMLRYKKLTNGNKGFKMGLWHYPFRLLKRELEVNH